MKVVYTYNGETIIYRKADINSSRANSILHQSTSCRKQLITAVSRCGQWIAFHVPDTCTSASSTDVTAEWPEYGNNKFVNKLYKVLKADLNLVVRALRSYDLLFSNC